MEFNADVKHEIGTRIYVKCGICCMITEQVVIPATHTDTQATQCTECQRIDEWIV
ncbi:hypothetical protein ACPA0F_18570 [Solibacillus silvestris]